MRNLRPGHRQPESLVCDSVRRFPTHCPQVEFRSSQRGRRSPLLRRSPCSGLHQSMVRLDLLAAQTGLREAFVCVVKSNPSYVMYLNPARSRSDTHLSPRMETGHW
jgi:hypothetical protein